MVYWPPCASAGSTGVHHSAPAVPGDHQTGAAGGPGQASLRLQTTSSRDSPRAGRYVYIYHVHMDQ